MKPTKTAYPNAGIIKVNNTPIGEVFYVVTDTTVPRKEMVVYDAQINEEDAEAILKKLKKQKLAE